MWLHTFCKNFLQVMANIQLKSETFHTITTEIKCLQEENKEK